MLKHKLLLLLSFFLALSAFADESATKNHGPRAGKILGSGDVLAEVVWWGAEKLDIYFLDPVWVDIREKGISLRVELVRPPNVINPIACQTASPGFSCKITDAGTLKEGDKLRISRLKDGTNPKEFEYLFPPAAH